MNNLIEQFKRDMESFEKSISRTHCPASCDGHGTYAEMGENGDPEPAQCQWCDEVVIPLRHGFLSSTLSLITKMMEELDEERHQVSDGWDDPRRIGAHKALTIIISQLQEFKEFLLNNLNEK